MLPPRTGRRLSGGVSTGRKRPLGVPNGDPGQVDFVPIAPVVIVCAVPSAMNGHITGPVAAAGSVASGRGKRSGKPHEQLGRDSAWGNSPLRPSVPLEELPGPAPAGSELQRLCHGHREARGHNLVDQGLKVLALHRCMIDPPAPHFQQQPLCQRCGRRIAAHHLRFVLR